MDKPEYVRRAWVAIDNVLADLGAQDPWDARYTIYHVDLPQWWDWPLGEERTRPGLWSTSGEYIEGTGEAVVRAQALRDATILCDHHWRTWQTSPYQSPTTAPRGPWDWGALPPYRDLGWAWAPFSRPDPYGLSVASRLHNYLRPKDHAFGAKRLVVLNGPLARWVPGPDMFEGTAGTRRSRHIRELLDLWTLLLHLPVSDSAREVLKQLATPTVGGMARIVRHEINPGLTRWLEMHGLATVNKDRLVTTRGVRDADYFELSPRGRLLCFIKRSFHTALKTTEVR